MILQHRKIQSWQPYSSLRINYAVSWTMGETSLQLGYGFHQVPWYHHVTKCYVARFAYFVPYLKIVYGTEKNRASKLNANLSHTCIYTLVMVLARLKFFYLHSSTGWVGPQLCNKMLGNKANIPKL